MKIRELDYEEFERQRKKISPNRLKTYKSLLKNGIKILRKIKKYGDFNNDEDILVDFLKNKMNNKIYLKEEFDNQHDLNMDTYQDITSAFRKYKNYVLEGSIINQKRDFFIEISKYHELEYQKTNATYFQIYPKNIPIEGSGGTHYEFISENSILFLEIHIESKTTIDITNFREKMKVFVEKSKYKFNTKTRPIKIDISKYSDNEIQDKFSEIYSKFQPFIEESYKELNNERKEDLLDEFNRFVENTDWDKNEWYKELKDSCETMQNIKKGIGNINTLEEFEEHLKEKTENRLKNLGDFIEKYIFQQKNGIADVGQGVIYDTEKSPHKKEIEKRIKNNINFILDPLKSDEIEKSESLIEDILKVSKGKTYDSVKYRFLIALFPKKMTAIAYKKQINILFKKIKDQFEIEKSGKNILEHHKWLMEHLEKSDEDLYKKQIFYWDLYHKLTREQSFRDKEKGDNGMGNKNKINQPLNQILYGPPGTGKTYNTINKALEIIDNEFYLENQNNREILREKFEEYKENGQIEFITFHQSYGYEEFVEGIKAGTNDKEEIIYNIEDGIFKRLSKEAKRNYIKAARAKNIKQDFEVIFKEKILDKLTEDSLKINTTRGFFEITEINKTTIYFDKSKGNSKHSLSIKTLKEMYEKEENYIKGGLSGYYSGILNILLDKSIVTIKENEESKNYVLIIDEINRGNMSKIFGELITLIEGCKRLGGKEELKITLPYSGEKFGVPNNLYILGTMNTADRSIALMDTALRRRFDFEEMMPNHNLADISIDIEGINLQEFLRVINQRVEYLYNRDHMIGHAYFIGLETKKELDEVMRNKIIPLLQEYFYDDWEKIQIVLGDHEKQKYEISLDNADRFIVAEKLKEIDILGFDHDDIENDSISYTINSEFTETAYMIYEEE